MQVTQQIWQDLIDGRAHYHGDVPAKPLLFPGSFNPVHDGHRQMAKIATELTRSDVVAEISVANVDKPPLDHSDLAARITEGRKLGRVLITRAAKFVEKARLFPGATFIVGADTAIRLDQARYYQSEIARDRAIDELDSLGSEFLIFGRELRGEFRDANQLDLSPRLGKICRFVPTTRFRMDISSTQIRNARRS